MVYFKIFVGVSNLQDESIDDPIVTVLVLPIMEDMNPSSHAVQAKVLEKFEDKAGIRAEGGRFWTHIEGDAGAVNVGELLKDFSVTILITMATGHYEMAIIRLMMILVCLIGGDHFIYAHKFKEGGGGPGYLKSCKDNHYAYDFIIIFIHRNDKAIFIAGGW